MFKLIEPYQPTGDQPTAIEKITRGFLGHKKYQTLLGVTGSGKTYSMGHVINNLQLPTLVISHNKTLAAQLYQEFREYFPENSVHYFVSYYDYYQPEAYLPHSDIYIEKDSRINGEIDRLRHEATQALLSRKDIIIVSSVSCIYNLGNPRDYANMSLELFEGQSLSLTDFVKHLNRLQYFRDYELKRGAFRNTKNEVEVLSATGNTIYRVIFAHNRIKRISVAQQVDTGNLEFAKPHYQSVLQTRVFPAKYWITPDRKLDIAIENIKAELQQWTKKLKSSDKALEAERLTERTFRDIHMMKQTGYCHGIENYSRHLDFRAATQPPFTLLDYFNSKGEFLTIVDESHITLSQLRGMYRGDRRRKQTLVEYGFRLPSALDNRPLVFEEFEKCTGKTLYVSATPAKYELKKAGKTGLVEQIVRPTGLLDPNIKIESTKNQIGHLIEQIKKRSLAGERVLITTFTKRMAEDLTEYLNNAGLKVNYIHSDIKTLDRLEIIRDLRTGAYDAIVGVNLLREGLDIPEVSLVAILDADKEGFLRNATTLIQTMGRATRHINGEVILYGDKITQSMKSAIEETNRRRTIQQEYNKKHGITPRSIKKAIKEYDLPVKRRKEELYTSDYRAVLASNSTGGDAQKAIAQLQKAMQKATKALDFETALMIRDQIIKLRRRAERDF